MEEEKKIEVVFTNRRVTATLGRTLKTSADRYEFIKFALGFEGDIADDVDRSAAHDQIVKELTNEMVIREAAIKAAYNNDDIDQLVQLLKSLQRDAELRRQQEAQNAEDTNVPESNTP